MEKLPPSDIRAVFTFPTVSANWIAAECISWQDSKTAMSISRDLNGTTPRNFPRASSSIRCRTCSRALALRAWWTWALIQNTLALRERIESGEVPGPRILAAGTPLYPPNGVPSYIKTNLPLTMLKELPQPATPAEAAREVDRQVAQGADIISLFTGSPVAPGHIVTMPLAVAQAAVAEAHKRGKLVFANPSNVTGLQIALQSHVDVIAHAIENTSGWNPDYL